MTRLIVGLLLALFISSVQAVTVPVGQLDMPQQWQAAKSEPQSTYNCYVYSYIYGDNGQGDMSLDACVTFVENYLQRRMDEMGNAPGTDFYIYSDVTPYIYSGSTYRIRYTSVRHFASGTVAAPEQAVAAQARFINNGEIYVCPPVGFPDHKVGPVDANGDGKVQECTINNDWQLCPMGFYRIAYNGLCATTNCPRSGSVSSFFTYSKVNQDFKGTFCDGECAYSMSQGGIAYNGATTGTGVSLGAVCGQSKLAENAWSVSESEEGKCTRSTNQAGSVSLDCTSAIKTETDTSYENPEPDTLQSENTTVDAGQDLPKYEGADCSTAGDGTLSCVGTNMVEAEYRSANELNKAAADRHNKLIKSQQDIANFLEGQAIQREARNNATNASNTAALIGAITGAAGYSVGGSEGGEENPDLVEEFEPQTFYDELQGVLDGGSLQLDDAYQALQDATTEAQSEFDPEAGVWSQFKQIPDYLPSDATCTPFKVGSDSHYVMLDICQYNDMIKAVVAFMFVFLTGWRLFLLSQKLVRNVALANA